MATQENRIDGSVMNVDLTVTEEDEKYAAAFAKREDPKGEEDVLFCGRFKGGKEFGLFYIVARTGTRNKTMKKKDLPEVRWMPHKKSSVDAFVRYYCWTYGVDVPTGFRYLCTRSLGQEMIVLRQKVKSADGKKVVGRRSAFDVAAA